ncbi:RodZ domain-containing protein [Lyngbya aestuarii]|uniref:RodZ domain-containing protein n=1 Tax=Lyngbya aestuarii TaxID=118322 RepID=UPI00403E1047
MNSLNPAQAEQLKKIGAYLREIRQEQSISTEQVANKTFISSRLLKALEEGQSDQLPEPVFVQGFIRRYADCLNLDGMALAKTFPLNVTPINITPIKPDASSQQIPQSPSIDISSRVAAVKSQTAQAIALKPRAAVIKPYLSYILFFVAAASGLLYLINRPQTLQSSTEARKASATQQQKFTNNSIASTTVASTVPKTPAPAPLAVKSPSPKASPASQASKAIKLAVNLEEKSWLRVIVDGKTEFEGILDKGAQQTWTAQKQLTLRSGNAGGVEYSLNQQQPKLLGAVGAVKEMTFTPNQ